MHKRGFTLIELMIVIAIIGILATIAIPRFVHLSDKAKEASTVANLSAIRSALSIYHADTDGLWPNTLDNQEFEDPVTGRRHPAFIPQYMEQIPERKLPRATGHPDTNAVIHVPVGQNIDPNQCYNGWVYEQLRGVVRIGCSEMNMAGTQRYNDY